MDKKFSDLPAASSVGSSDLIALDQGGSSKKFSLGAVAANLLSLATPGSDGSIVYIDSDGSIHTELASALIISSVKDSTDPTKQLSFDVSAIPNGTTRILAFSSAGTIPNAGLANSSMTIAGHSVSLGGTQALAIGDLSDSTTVGQNIVKLANPSAVSFIKIAADNSVSTRTPAQVLSDIGAQTSGSYAVTGSGNTFTGNQVITEAAAGSGLTITGATQTTSQPVLSLSQTWNASGITFTGIKLNVTATASATASLLLDLQRGGVSQLSIDKSGNMTIPNNGAAITVNGAVVFFNFAGGGGPVFSDGAGHTFATMYPSRTSYVSTMPLGWTSSSTDSTGGNDTAFTRISAGLVGVGTGGAGSFAGSLKLTDIFTNNATALIRTTTALTGGGTSNTPTLTSGPVTGNPTKWIPIDDNGTTRYIPSW